MRLTVKYLQEQLENEKVHSKQYYKLWQEAKNELHEKEKLEETISYNNRNYNDAEIMRLMEIIRIPAKDPRLEMTVDTNSRYN